jgi:hypothetical protein
MELEIIVEGEGLQDLETIGIPNGSEAREIVKRVAARNGFPAEEGILFLEDSSETLDLSGILTEEAVSGEVFHVHRLREIDVVVYYKEDKKEHKYPPSTRIQRVLDWAVGPDGFNIDKTIAPEMELALHGQTTALPKNAHIGRYLRHPDHELAFDLIRGIVPNGGNH